MQKLSKAEPLATRRSAGFTLIELLVVVAIIAILAAILFPVFATAREKARQTTCLSNMKQLGLAVMQYTQDSDEKFPRFASNPAVFHPSRLNPTRPAEKYISSNISTEGYMETWMDYIFPYVKSLQAFDCPSHKRPVQVPGPGEPMSWYTGGSYFAASGEPYMTGERAGTSWTPSVGVNSFITGLYIPGPASLGALKGSSTKLFGFHNSGPYFYSNPAEFQARANSKNKGFFPHNDGTNFLFCDGHVKWIAREKVRQLTCAAGGAVPTAANWNDYYNPNAGCGFWKPAIEPPSL